MHDEAGIARISRRGRTDRYISLIGSSIVRGSQRDRFVSQPGVAVWLRRNHNRCGRRTLLPTLRRTGGHIRSEIAERQRNGAQGRRQRRGNVRWKTLGGIRNNQFRWRRFEAENNRRWRNIWRAGAAK